MSDIEHHYISGMCCDRCGAERKTPGLIHRVTKEANEFRAAAYAAGWSRWGSRGARDYCPNCAPNPGHKMRRIA